MDRFEGLIRGILWLSKKDWGRSLLLGFASLAVLATMSAGKVPMADAVLSGPVFRAGFYVGSIVMPNETVGGHSLFGSGAVFLMLWGLWFFLLRLMHRLSANKAG